MANFEELGGVLRAGEPAERDLCAGTFRRQMEGSDRWGSCAWCLERAVYQNWRRALSERRKTRMEVWKSLLRLLKLAMTVLASEPKR